MHDIASSLPNLHGVEAPATRPRARRWWKAALVIGLVALAPAALAGPYKIFGNHYAWVNNFNDPNNIIQGTFGTGSTPELTVTFNFADYNLYGYPAIVRGWHYDWNPTSDTLFPKQISSISALPFKFNYSAGGSNLAGDFAYDIFFRWDTAKGNPQLEVMIWGRAQLLADRHGDRHQGHHRRWSHLRPVGRLQLRRGLLRLHLHPDRHRGPAHAQDQRQPQHRCQAIPDLAAEQSCQGWSLQQQHVPACG